MKNKHVTIVMKMLVVAALLVFCGLNSWGQLLYDDFTGFTVGNNLATQSSWTKGGSGPDATIGNTTALTYSTYNGGGGEYVVMPTASSTASRVYKGYTTTTVSTGTFYVSFLLRLTSTNATGDYFISLGDAVGGTNYYVKIFAKSSGAGYVLGVSRQNNVSTATFGAGINNFNQTYLILVRFTGISGTTNDQLNLWVNPTISSEPLTANAYVTHSGSDSDPTSLGQFIWHNRSTNNPVGSFDGVRVAYGATSAAAWTNLNAYLASSNDANSKVEAPATQVASGDVSSTATSSGSAVPVYCFKIRDLATSDALSTKVTQVKIKKLSGTADWTDHIAGAAFGMEVLR
ncbi:MAG TPA: hypothetical protein PKN48_02495 [Bacteroidales bacterium]|nr:hypothetical protein [Bacteroidales bacterium]